MYAQDEVLGARRVLDVVVSIDEAGQQALAVELDDLGRRPDPGLDIPTGAHGSDTIADDRYRLMEAALRVHGDDVATTQDEVGARDDLLTRRAGAAGADAKGQQKKRPSSASTKSSQGHRYIVSLGAAIDRHTTEISIGSLESKRAPSGSNTNDCINDWPMRLS